MGQWKTKDLELAKSTLMGLIPSTTLNSRLIFCKFYDPVSLSFFICKTEIVSLLQGYSEDFNQ